MALLLATEQNLQKIKLWADAARLVGKDKIGVAVGKVVKHFELLITDNALTTVRNTCRAPNGADDAPTFQITTTPNPKQKRPLDLINQIKM